MNTDLSTPQFQDLPEGRLAERKEHLLSETTNQSRPRLVFPSFTLGRPRAVGIASAALLAAATAMIAVVATSGRAAQGTSIGGSHRSAITHSRPGGKTAGTSTNCGIEPQQNYPQPPTGFDPTTATASQLQEYGFPPRPAGDSTSAAQQGWLQAMAAWKVSDTPQQTCGSVSHHRPDPVAHSAPRGTH